MRLNAPKGKYVIAISGGVDSMALLDMLSNLPGVELVVAYFNHGIREDSPKDEALIIRVAKKYGLPLEIGRAKLKKNASEELARNARYKFLHEVKDKYDAKAIITAHHQDDLIETAFINILRGTGRRGLTSMAQNPDIIRPLLDTPKSELVKYAKIHKLRWREDTTNLDTRYLRNFIRQKLIPNLSASQRALLLKDIKKLNRLNPVLDREIANLSQTLLVGNKINRQKFINLPPEIAVEVLAYILRQENIRQFDKKTLERLAVSIKTAKSGSRHDIQKGAKLKIEREYALLSAGVNS